MAQLDRFIRLLVATFAFIITLCSQGKRCVIGSTVMLRKSCLWLGDGRRDRAALRGFMAWRKSTGRISALTRGESGPTGMKNGRSMISSRTLGRLGANFGGTPVSYHARASPLSTGRSDTSHRYVSDFGAVT